MGYFAAKDGGGNTIYFYAASGSGTTGDPYVVGQSVALTGDLPDTAAGDLAAILAKLSNVDLGATDNAALLAIAAALDDTLSVDGSGVTQPVSAASLPLPTGAATEATLADVKTAVETLDNAISGSEMQVDIVSTVEPSAVSLTWVTGTAASSGDNTLVAAPGASTRIVVYSLIVQNESSTATSAVVKSGSTAKMRALGQNQGDGIALNFQPGRELRLGTNEALVLNLSGANSHGYTVAYATEAV